MVAFTFEALQSEYASLWQTMRVNAHKAADVEAAANKIVANKSRYEQVEAETSVPWWLVGVIHKMEANCNFQCHLHNGDPLTARTRLVPSGRPATGKPPFPWKVSACDALELKSLGDITDWCIERVCYELERYNGSGYRRHHPETLSPYLWSYSNHYVRGKYIADGKWSSTAISAQCGAMPLIKEICDREGIELRSMLDAPPPPEKDIGSAGGWEEIEVIPETHGEEQVNAPSQRPPPAPTPDAPVARAAPAPEETADEAPGFMATRKFAALNNLVDQGSRTARSIKHGKDAAIGLAAGAGSVGTAWGWSQTVIAIALLVGAIALVTYGIAKLMEKHFVAAADDNRYQPKKRLA